MDELTTLRLQNLITAGETFAMIDDPGERLAYLRRFYARRHLNGVDPADAGREDAFQAWIEGVAR